MASTNPVIRELNGEAAQRRKERQQEISSRPRTWTPASAQTSVFTPAQKSEMVSLENQRRQAQVDMDIDTMNALDARMKAIRASAGQQTFGDRADENFSGWVKGTAAAYSKAAEDALNFVKHLNTVNSNEYKAARQEEQNAAHYQEMLDRGTWDNGKPLTDADRAQLTTLIQRSGGKVKAASDYLDKVNAPVASAAEKVGGFGDRMAQESGTHNEAARTGATALEKILLDTGNVSADVASDMAGNLLLPGLGTAGRVTRLYGSGSRAAEEKGLGGLGQFGYGATKAALGEATNRLFSGNPILEKATGKGALDDLLFPNLGRTIPGSMLKSGLGEAVEETAENLADIPIQKVFFGDKADQVSAKDIGYDALIAAIIGGITGISGKKNTDTMDGEGSPRISQNTPAGDMPVDAEGNSMGAAENAVQGVSDANNGMPRTEAKPVTLEEILFGGKRVGMDKLTDAQAQQADAWNMAGTVGMDADSRLFQIDPAQHIDQRGAAQIADRRVNAFQYDHPQLHAYYKGAAEAMLNELSGAVKGGETQTATGEYGQTYSWRNKRNASPRIASLLDGGMTYADIETALDAIIHDKGQENYANAKRVEMVLDDMLTNGYNDGTQFVPANQQYIAAKDAIAGSQADSRGHGLDDIDSDMGGEPASNENSGEGIKVYRGYQLSDDPTQKNLQSVQSVFDIIGKGMKERELVPLMYYTESVDDATNYAHRGGDIVESLKEVAAMDYWDNVVKSGKSIAESKEDYINRKAREIYKTLYGSDVPTNGYVQEETINPKKTLDLTSLGEKATVMDIYKEMSAQTGIPWGDIDDAIILSDISEAAAEGDPIDVFLIMRNNGNRVGTKFVDLIRALGFDSVKYKESGTNHYAVVSGETIASNDGLGNANAGTVNTAFDEMQAKSDSFHPVNPNSAQRIMNDQQRAPSEVPTVNPDTGKNIGKTVSTILNSPLTSPEMATQIESAVADGQFDYIPVTDKDANLKAQQDLSNRGLQTVADSFIAKVDLGQRITKNDTASAIAAYNQAVADGNHALAFDLMTAIADAAHDSAQVVQSMNLMNRLTPEGKLLTLRKYVDKLNRQNRSKPGRQAATANATQEQVDAARTNYVEQATGFRISDELAANYLMAETDAERAAAWDAITTDIANQLPSTFREKANFWRYTSMLLNPTTHVRNFLGNAIQAGARTIKNGVGAVIERAVVKDASQRTKSVVLGKEGKALRDFAKSQYEADKGAAMGAGKYSDASAAGISREIQEKRNVFTAKMQGRAAETISNIVPQAVHTAADAAGKAVQAVGDFNTRLLDLGDVIFNKSAYVDSFAQALQAKGVTAAEAAGGAKSDLVAQARAYAIEEAQKATYRNTTALSELLSNAGRYEGNNPIAKALSIGYDAFMPFRRTPANILTTGIDYSPVGLAKAITYDAYQVKAGNMSAADMVDHLSAGLTGSGILALGAYLAAEGLLKVRTGDDDREKEYNQDRGMQDYSLQIGDKSYTLDWAVPAAMPLFAGAAIMESAGEGGSGFDAVMDAMGGISEVVLETSMLSSLNDLISNWSYADNKGLYLLDRIATSYAGQYVPTVGGKIASAMDDTVRKSYVEKGTGQLASDLGYFAQSMEKKIPGARDTLQPKVDLWGEEVSNGKVTDRLLQSFLSPGYAKTVDTSALDKELRRLAEATGSSAVYPAEVEKTFKVGGETKNLTAEEYTKYAKAVGQTRYQAVSALTGNSGYKKLTDEEKAKAVAYAYEYATVKGKQAVSGYKPGDSSFAKGAMNSVLPIDSYILYKITADKDGNGSVSGTESAKALQAMSGLTDKQRWQEWARLNDAKDKADKASTAGLTVGEYASMKEKADANGDGRVTKEEAMKALGSVKNRVDLWDIICTTSAKNPYR